MRADQHALIDLLLVKTCEGLALVPQERPRLSDFAQFCCFDLIRSQRRITARDTQREKQMPLRIADGEAEEEFRALARTFGKDPDDPFVGNYAARVWRRARPLIEAYAAPIAKKQVLEFGCNLGATAIVLARLGALVEAVDIDAKMIQLARLNAARYRITDIAFSLLPAPPATALPFADGSFDIIVCNSVLEYVEPTHLLRPVVEEFSRLLRSGGILLVLGTSNRLMPREVHSRRWLANYLPRRLDELSGTNVQRGISPWRLRRLLRPTFVDLVQLDPLPYLAARIAAGEPALRNSMLDAFLPLCRLFGCSLGMLTPSFFLAMRRSAGVHHSATSGLNPTLGAHA